MASLLIAFYFNSEGSKNVESTNEKIEAISQELNQFLVKQNNTQTDPRSIEITNEMLEKIEQSTKEKNRLLSQLEESNQFQTFGVFVKDDATIDEDFRDSNYGMDQVLASGYTTAINEDAIKQAHTYLKFDIQSIPTSNMVENTIIADTKLNLFAHIIWGDSESYLVTVYSCLDNSWSEKTITWNNRPCSENLIFEDSIIISNNNFSNNLSWDVTNGINKAMLNNISSITFIIKSMSLDTTKHLDSLGSPGPDDHIVWYWSSEKDIEGISPNLTGFYSINSNYYEYVNEAIIFGVGIVVGIVLSLKLIKNKTNK